jgi:predicted nuclease of restriction endonuclease-like (RecB) superfamily
MSGALPAGYTDFLAALKTRIRSAQLRAALKVNRELLALYWDIGRALVSRQEGAGWGAKVIDRLAADLQRAFPGVSGFSRANVYRMRAFYLAYPPEAEIVAQPARQSTQPSFSPDGEGLLRSVADLPWGHHIVLLERVKEAPPRAWYAEQALAHGWSRNVLVTQIESRLYERQGKALTNFREALPSPQSDLAQQTLKDPYVFDFLVLSREAEEHALEAGLVDHVQKFLLELGAGFAFVGRQVPLRVGAREFYLDLLFYHLKLRCFVVIELKAGSFEPEYAGKMNFYLSAVDAELRHPDDKPSLGLLLCKEKDQLVVEYALRDLKKPIGVAEWETKLVESLPENLKGSLPSVEELEAELAPDRNKA